MHEYSIVSALIEQCEQYAKANQATKVTRVEIKLGVMSGVEPALLQTAFETFKLDGICREAKLCMTLQPLVIKCADCQQESVLDERSIVCPACNSYHTRVLDGEEMLLMQLEMEQAEDA
ncbi:hydrogenase maturation nickel metallochaperone HypA [Shewanella oneidensis MR-1]|uniref:Hydrogenase maturation factor HypA n=1 Tax=Shewanella oneidensis (strain ATCC 700550 / JCM 31522 / CIP 106686 / LMG 19005 / NCIMB 14063 / MR-1) TaxID=211586 RepID=HYPA_SHEON|nr:hydrogenase maturation nickel metallochaperone HypA [Shewanella oneidensis]Q8EF96.1 RecName: Full=Hydrogenase maturation factor HypA [Shewanella oneidensis MR-1]AAN55136.1 NiFe hydrogenase nickel incorporation protein HypA [Shewanella oneidensis MR-1]MDX5996173.1 hydrogenase maturation nickel metallochaperone HypA [Shewanella oneidensis]MEE2027835.1 Hydrogenase/urease maturation factor HypA [Shewanella oneidensis]QKG96701.1 hydrogenase maturation nickel metallochaperone HypA [Shewanella one